MIQKVDIPVSVLLYHDPQKSKTLPVSISYNARDYKIQKIGFHHTFRTGRTLFHVFSVVAQGTFFRLVFNTDNLFWRLEEISDGYAD
ncbi:hypothetical protein A2574_03440 [Candidatus Shapirobacteria bacterium RIFOXYD1_FULL_38_32]|uniref:Uncharacterized protein n=2 Tax=Candidatus Shapironibacteriota TaxID=1752721 RepID=A0A0G0JUZ7_9BACT|nr:MAG: hypothetical protein US90_C0006G0035 [Candidatus Shapirobacteria bacterium GW2011_GWE2_38_30]OGL55021.1 MAG: hypothetical protein A2195_01785 [Candidatus Shapirobacteria bacterium RIFOXYA1_FULL_39_17]OGL56113.1 MAG: hypothetical protein A2410_00910 [Candidatus Shapirobacteria bacterium RIFOXYC1_FULL_38_24]OGL56832.1 MAG: hypothetical protein A2367_01350 [Candidatus Shapirobacteria bacterium RIFOXYB1_FULL_38_38]OGL58105.1 MAG: hypothetical protein A2574_03440 [Candidatus Shapirobacteria 